MADVSKGTALTWAATTVGEIVSIAGPGVTSEPVDDTTLADSWKTFLGPALADGGECTLEMLFEPDTVIVGKLEADMIAGTAQATVITFNDTTSTTWTFNALVTGLSPGATVGDKLSSSVTLKTTGSVAVGP